MKIRSFLPIFLLTDGTQRHFAFFHKLHLQNGYNVVIIVVSEESSLSTK